MSLPASLSRRNWLAGALLAAQWPPGAAGATLAAALVPGSLRFPRDAGSHPDFRTEWWYITGFVSTGGADRGRDFGFQVTFFRSRIEATQALKSAFAAKQLIFAHAALTDVQGRRLWHDQRIARSSGAPAVDLASAREDRMGVALRDWSLQQPDQRISASVTGTNFALDLQFTPGQTVLLQGDRGVSRKGPEQQQASYYYSLPHLAVTGNIVLAGRRYAVAQGQAWLDHEWSHELLHPQAIGWDWIGMNLFDGSALTAFQLRRKSTGSELAPALWDGGSFYSIKGGLYVFQRGETTFRPTRMWKSPVSQASYPVEWLVRTPADFYSVRAVIDQQELDSRGSTGAIYWEGLSDLFDSYGKHVGRGYLEMTGYAAPLRM